MAESRRVITVYTEASPNPNSLKFVLNFSLLENMSIDYPSKEEASNSPLAIALFEEYSFIQRLFVASNFITVTKDDATDWFEVNPKIRHFIKEWFTAEKPIFEQSIEADIAKKNEAEKPQASATDGELEERIKVVLDEYVRPAVEGDGGAISFHSFNDGVVKVLLQGSCSGCPSSTITLKQGIENLLTRMVPEVKEVVAEGV